MSRAAGEKAQRKMLEEHGAVPIYDAKTHTIDQMIVQLRKGDEVAVTSLGRLATTRAGLRYALDAIRAKGCVVVELASGRRTSCAAEAAQMALDAADELSMDARGTSPELGRKWGAVGGRLARLRVEREMAEARMPKAEAKNIWRNPLLTNAQALAQMPGWTQASAYRRLKSRKLAKGRPRSEKIET